MIVNEKGRIWYGLHFYPGVAEYREPGKSSYRVFLNESTIRKMDASFAGRPVFVLHSDDELEGMSVDELRQRADGWVIESFFNQADGKHWAKFITVSEKADDCIGKGWTLSNAYIMKNTAHGGQWNGVDYQREITDAAYDHLAIVPNPRYEESMVLTPEQFKKYNEERLSELRKVANDKSKRGKEMKFKMFKREKIENNADIENVVVTLTKSKKDVVIVDALEQLDDLLFRNADKPVEQLTIKIDETESMTIGDLKKKYVEIKNALTELQNEKECNSDEDGEDDEDEDEMVENEEDEEARKKALELAAHEEKEMEERKKKNKKKNSEELTVEEKKKKEKDRQKAEELRNAHKRKVENDSSEVVYISGVDKGKARYGS